ncbi:MAG: hypothetical protein C4325_13180 [Blastocatellia bacterium]
MSGIGAGDKGYRITLEDRSEYLFVKVEGEFDAPEISTRYWDEIAEKCSELRPSRLFVEEDLRKQIETIADVYEAAAESSTRALLGIRIAFFDTQPDHYEKNLFAELVSRNRGLNVKVFRSREQAVEWLLADE